MNDATVKSSDARVLTGPVLFSAALALVVVFGVLFPRSLSFTPALAGLGGLVILFIRERPLARPCWSMLWAPALILALAYLSCIWSIDAEGSLDRCLKITPIFVFATALAYSLSCLPVTWLEPLPRYLCFALLFGLFFNTFELASEGLVYKLFRDDDLEYYLSAHNRSVLFTLLCTPLTLYVLSFAGFSEKTKTLWTALVLLSLGAVLFLTESQTAHLATLLALAAYFFPLKNKGVRYAFLAVLGGLLFTAPWIAQYLFKVLPDMIMQVSWFREGYAPERLEIWDFVSRYAMQSPVVGHGIEATRAVEAFDTQMLYRETATVLHPHNFAIQLWMEFGLLGVIASLVFFVYILHQLTKLPTPLGSYAFASVMIAMTSAATAYGLWQGWLLGAFMLVWALIVAISRLEKNTAH